ncbi:exodeoxyribonuclease VIII [Rhodobacteraceae bacterium R_SAG2]|nr:exodeoxyribonuclease VIII [Rhodobacteraceae bacterium R_SAG2]
MTDNNLRHWERFDDIDPKYTKAITGKAYKGTSPNPQYVIKCLTEIFGPVGEGFGWDVVAEDFTPMGDELLHWCRIKFWHTDRANTFDSYGQTKAIMKTRNGLMSDEDAPKKSLTDAVIKAASHIGVAANIFLGRWDDQKYVAEVNAEYRAAEGPQFDSAGASERIQTAIGKQTTPDDLSKLWNAEKETMSKLTDEDFAAVKAAFAAAGAKLNQPEERAA